MASCLGLYIEPNIIKYAKISKDHDILKVDSFGIKFYDRLGDAIRQVVNDTYSFKDQISINLSEEVYNYFYMFSLLNKNDLKKAINTEFESLCTEKNVNKNAYETRYAMVKSLEEKEKIKVIHVSSNKNSINTSEQAMGEFKVSTISPIGISISNVPMLKEKENVLIINMEEKTILTTIVDQKVYNVQTIEEGSKAILDNINAKENSFSKAFEICKNTTIYTAEGKELQEGENEYLEDIMPTLYTIANKVQEIIANDGLKIDKIYLTGTLSVINNVDLYFQEFFSTEKCEIMKPHFLTDNVKINLKDYIEVNSAIGLALQGLDYGLREMNFKKKSWSSNKGTKSDSGKKSINDGLSKSINISEFFRVDFRSKLDKIERWMLRALGGALILTIIYSIFSIYLKFSIEEKNKEVADVKAYTNAQIAAVETDIERVKQKTSKYEALSAELIEINKQVEEHKRVELSIPILLTQIMSAMPKGVQVTSIENTTAHHIVINAQSEKYEQLGIFKAVLRTKGILDPETVISSYSVKTGNIVQVVIEGDLP